MRTVAERGTRVIESAAEMREWARLARRGGESVALVPTMGALHEGHCTLMRAAARLAGRIVVSIYVNPSQFGPGEDFERYPRTPEADRDLCAREGVDVVFAPPQLYGTGHSTWVEETDLSRCLEGEFRPGHFRGVLTVVLKLLHIVEPDLAVFGQKDAQQALLVRRLARDLDLGSRIVVEPTVREADGLALSSRNVRLGPEARRAAPVLHRALAAAARAVEAGEADHGRVMEAGRGLLLGVPGLEIDYFTIIDPSTFQPATGVPPPLLIVGAVRLDGVRLLDNRAIPEGALLGDGMEGSRP